MVFNAKAWNRLFFQSFCCRFFFCAWDCCPNAWPSFGQPLTIRLYNTLVYRRSHEPNDCCKKVQIITSTTVLDSRYETLVLICCGWFLPNMANMAHRGQTFPLWSDLSEGLATCPSFCFYRDFTPPGSCVLLIHIEAVRVYLLVWQLSNIEILFFFFFSG